VKVALKSLGPLVIGMICAGVCPGIGAGQSATPGGPTARSANEAKSLVQGKVVQEPGGQGIRKVRVILRGGSQQGREHFEATTDDTGGFKIEGLAPGVYAVQLERSGYAADRKTNRNKTTITVVAGQDTKDLVFHMLVAGAITGKIVDADGDPLQNVDVMAIVEAGGAPRGYQTQSGRGGTNDLGEYRIGDLPPGKYIVQAAPPRNEVPPHSQNEKNTTNGRLVYVTTYFPGTLDQRQAAAVEVSAAGTAIASFGVRSSHAYLVSGTVMGLTAQPKPRDNTSETFVAVMSQGIGQLLLTGKNGQREEQNLGEDGKFEFPNVLPGTYRAQVIVFSGFFDGQTPSIKMQTISTPIEVNGSDVVGLRLQVDRSGDVSGKFHVDGDEKIDWKELNVGLVMVLESEEEEAGFEMMEQAGMARVNEDGSFEIKDVPGVNYQLAVGARSEKFRDYYTKSVLLGGREVADTGFAVSPGTVLDVLVSAKGAGIEGTVVDRESKPVPDAAVVTVPSTGKLGRPDAYQFAMSDESGHFAMRGMNPGGFLVLAFEEMRENYRLPAFAKKYEGKGQKVELEEGGRKSVVLKLITQEGE
jgi:Carboxypeptidase regulatory-like domain